MSTIDGLVSREAMSIEVPIVYGFFVAPFGCQRSDIGFELSVGPPHRHAEHYW